MDSCQEWRNGNQVELELRISLYCFVFQDLFLAISRTVQFKSTDDFAVFLDFIKKKEGLTDFRFSFQKKTVNALAISLKHIEVPLRKRLVKSVSQTLNTPGTRVGLGGRDRMLAIKKGKTCWRLQILKIIFLLHIPSSWVGIWVPTKISFMGTTKLGEKQ